MSYTPQVGDHVEARRKVRQLGMYNLVLGPVTRIWDDLVMITTNRGDPDLETDYYLATDAWHFTLIHRPSVLKGTLT